MDPLVTTGITSGNVASVVSGVLREAEGIEVESVQQMAELLERDINRVDADRYESPLTFLLPLAISPTTGSRSSIARYINSIIDAGYPLTISLHSLATKILFEDCEGKPRATGVEYMVGEGLYAADRRYNASQQGEIRTVRAKKEVIVSGGTFNTPQLLQLSGIGPRQELERLGVPVIVDLPAVVSLFYAVYASKSAMTNSLPRETTCRTTTNPPCTSAPQRHGWTLQTQPARAPSTPPTPVS